LERERPGHAGTSRYRAQVRLSETAISLGGRSSFSGCYCWPLREAAGELADEAPARRAEAREAADEVAGEGLARRAEPKSRVLGEPLVAGRGVSLLSGYDVAAVGRPLRAARAGWRYLEEEPVAPFSPLPFWLSLVLRESASFQVVPRVEHSISAGFLRPEPSQPVPYLSAPSLLRASAVPPFVAL